MPPLTEYAAMPFRELNVDATLDSGQCFRWLRDADGTWSGVMGRSVVFLAPDAGGFRWWTWPEPGRWDILERYFALDVSLLDLQHDWICAEPRIRPSLERHGGLRILQQDVEEAFFSFLCASCNTITKIKRSVSALAARYGDRIGEVDGRAFFVFPTAERLAEGSEVDLRADLWGYRAPRLIEIAGIVTANGGRAWLEALRNSPYREAHCELMTIPGIGPKIADCICLFAFGHAEAVPIDTHVRKSVERLYRPDLVGRSLTPETYDAFAASLRVRFGPFAGWAQQYLFYDELLDSSILSERA